MFTGDVSDLFDSEELDAIVMEVKHDAIDNDVADSRSAMLQFFKQRVFRNLHIAVATSPAGTAFRRRCRTHPALVNCCTIDWSVSAYDFNIEYWFETDNHRLDILLDSQMSFACLTRTTVSKLVSVLYCFFLP